MPVWRITNGYRGEKEQHVEESLQNSVCGMRVNNLQIENRTLIEIRQDIDNLNPGRNPRVITGWTNQLINLRDEFTQGELVVMNDSDSSGFYIGIVEDDNYIYGPNCYINHRRNVQWSDQFSYDTIDEVLTRKIKNTPGSVTKVRYDNIELTLQNLLNQ